MSGRRRSRSDGIPTATCSRNRGDGRRSLQFGGQRGRLQSQERREQVDVLPARLLERRDLGGGGLHLGPRPHHLQARRESVSVLVLGDRERPPLLLQDGLIDLNLVAGLRGVRGTPVPSRPRPSARRRGVRQRRPARSLSPIPRRGALPRTRPRPRRRRSRPETGCPPGPGPTGRSPHRCRGIAGPRRRR